MARPLSYISQEALEAAVTAYFADCDERQRPYTISGLSHHLGVSRQTLLNYQDRSEFLDTIELAKAKCEAYTEEHLFSGKGVSGTIFNLRCNYGWREPESAKPEPTTYIIQEGPSLSDEDKQRLDNIMEMNRTGRPLAAVEAR